MAVWALFLDIDRTLTSTGYEIPKRNIDALKKARELGHKVFLNTGRSHGNIPPDICEQIDVDGIISGNGTVVSLGSEILYSDFMDRTVFEELASAVYDNENCWAVFEGLNCSYTVTGRNKLLSRSETDCSSFEALMERTRDDKIQVVAVNKGFCPALLERVKNEMSVYEFDTYYDIVPKGNNKSKGMARVLEMTGISPEHTMAFGDSENDMEMLINAGIGVAVANSQQQVIDIADYTAPSNEQGGVGEAIERFILKGVK